MAASRIRFGQQASENATIEERVITPTGNSSVEVDVELDDTDSDVAKKVHDAWNAGSDRPATVSRSGPELTFTCEGSTAPTYSTRENGGAFVIVPTHPTKHTYGCNLQVWVVP